MSRPQPHREHHERFCLTEDWKRVRDARGRTGTHHVTFELALHDGRVLRTRISHPVNRTSYGPALWRHILRDQLDVSEDTFWACVLDGTLPDRGEPPVPADALPAEMVHLLIHRVGLEAEVVAELSREEAAARLQRFWVDGV